MLVRLLFACLSIIVPAVAAAQSGGTAHLYAYTVKDRAAFEAGYRQHLRWHAAHADKLAWFAWYVTNGDRAGAFVDGTFGTTPDGLATGRSGRQPMALRLAPIPRAMAPTSGPMPDPMFRRSAMKVGNCGARRAARRHSNSGGREHIFTSMRSPRTTKPHSRLPLPRDHCRARPGIATSTERRDAIC